MAYCLHLHYMFVGFGCCGLLVFAAAVSGFGLLIACGVFAC